MIKSGFEDIRFTSTTFCNLSIAFDCVSHRLLMSNLINYNFSQNSMSLIELYHSERTQQVTVDGMLSVSGRVSVGVPQGSMLGP